MTNDERTIERYLKVRELVKEGKVQSVPPRLLRGYQGAVNRAKRAETGAWYSGHVYVTRNADPALIAMMSKCELNPRFTLTIQ